MLSRTNCLAAYVIFIASVGLAAPASAATGGGCNGPTDICVENCPTQDAANCDTLNCVLSCSKGCDGYPLEEYCNRA